MDKIDEDKIDVQYNEYCNNLFYDECNKINDDCDPDTEIKPSIFIGWLFFDTLLYTFFFVYFS